MSDLSFFDTIGFYAPFILLVTNSYFMYTKTIYFIFYLIFIFANEWLNRFLKTIFKQPRPIGYGDNIETKIVYQGAHLYGMPSGHIQSVFFSLAYSWFVLESPYLFFFELFICFVSAYQRIKYKRHTLNQVIVGSIVGLGFGTICYYFVKDFFIGRGGIPPFLRK